MLTNASSVSTASVVTVTPEAVVVIAVIFFTTGISAVKNAILLPTAKLLLRFEIAYTLSSVISTVAVSGITITSD